MDSINVQKLRTAGVIAGLCIVLAAAGYGAGRLIGNRFMESVILREGRLPLLLSRPVNQFYDVYTLINSGNPFSRLSGYYSLVDNNLVNEQFVADRYGREQFVVIHRTLLWVLSYAKDRDRALAFYDTVYQGADDSLKKDILRHMKKLDEKHYDDFIKRNRIDRSYLPD